MMNKRNIGTAAIDFIEFKVAMSSGTKAAGKAKVYYVDYMSNKINVETFFQALKELNREHQFILSGSNADAVVCSLNQQVEAELDRQFGTK